MQQKTAVYEEEMLQMEKTAASLESRSTKTQVLQTNRGSLK